MMNCLQEHGMTFTRKEKQEEDSGFLGTGYFTNTVTTIKMIPQYVLNNRLGAVYESS